MTIEEQVVEKLRELPPEKQKEVLSFVDSLKEKNGTKKPRRSLLGLWKDLDVHITEEDIAEARRMWGCPLFLWTLPLQWLLRKFLGASFLTCPPASSPQPPCI